MRKLFLFIVLMQALLLNAQNLVVNPSFENVVGTLECSWYTTQAQFDNAMDGWTCPTGGSTDIFSLTLATSCYCSPLSTNASAIGTQMPRTGDVMSHVTVYGDGGCDPYREYLQGELTTPLTVGQDYLVEFYVSLADYMAFATNNIGVYFVTSPVDVTSMCVYDVTPQLNNTDIITDDQNWTLISFTYTADAAYTHFMIGNFEYDAGTSTLPHTGSNGTIRYYVDDVSITEVDVVPTSDFTVSTPVCVGEDSDIEYTGNAPATATYHWSWDGGTASPGTGQGPHTVNWTTPGNYSVSLWVENLGNSSDVTTHVVTVNEVPTSSFMMTNVDCYGDNSTIVYNGSASSSATYNWDFDGGSIVSGSGQGPYEINWTNSGTHTVELTVEENGCTSPVTSHSLTVPTELQLTLDPTDASCFNSDDGSIASNVTGGTPGYSYAWSNAQVNPTATGLAPGNYTLVVTDTHSCTVSASASVDEPTQVTIIPGDDHDICYGETVQLSAQANGGAGSYTYFWNDGSGFVPGSASENFSPQSSRTFSVYAEDANGCTSSFGEIDVSVSLPIRLDLNITPISCNGNCDAIMDLNVSGGIAPFTFTGDFESDYAMGLCPGMYQVTITDDNGCMNDTMFVLNQPPALYGTVYADEVSCPGGNDGSAYIEVAGGVAPYHYHWISGESNDTALNLYAGQAGVTVTDHNGCIFTESVYINEPEDFIVVGVGNRHICIGGSASNTVSVTGGSSPYSFHWQGEDGFNWYNNTINVSPEETTVYDLTITDDHGCEETSSMTVFVNPPLNILSLQTDQPAVCKGESVTVYAQVEGGNGGPYEVLFDDNVHTFPYEFTPQTSGWHHLRLSDACETPSVYDSIYIEVYDLPLNNFVSDKVGGCPPLVVQFNELNPNDGKSYFWNFGDAGFSYGQQTTHNYETSGLYDVSLVVTDANGCQKIRTIENMVHVYPVPEVDFYTEPNEISMLNPLVSFYPITVNTDSLYWFYGDGDSTTISNWSPEHLYDGIGEYEVKLVGTNTFQCKDTMYKVLKVREFFTFYAPTAFTPNFDGDNDCFSICGAGIDPNEFSLIVYDRWGTPVFETDRYDDSFGCDGCGESAWDGTMQGNVSKGDKLLASGVYSWICVYKDLFGIEHFEQGVVRLIR